MSRSDSVRLLVPLLVAAMSANALPLSSLDEERPSPTAGIRPMLVREASFGIRVPVWTKVRYYFVRLGAWKGLTFAALALALAPFGFAVIPGVTAGFKAPANAIYAGGNPRERCIVNMKVKTATGLKAGIFVIRDTTDDEFSKAGAASTLVIGVLSEINWTQPKLATFTSAPTAGDICTIILVNHGARLRFISNFSHTMGELVNTDADGEATTAAVAAAGDFAKVPGAGRVLETKDTSTTAALVLGVI